MSFLPYEIGIAQDMEQKLMKRDWLPHQWNLIKMVEKHPFIYLPVPVGKKEEKQHRRKVRKAWEEIETLLDKPSKICKPVWNRIRLKYAKIMSLIATGVLSKEMVMSYSETRKFLNGSLSFLDPYLSAIPYENIPYHISNSINKIFGLGSTKSNVSGFITHEQVKALLKKRVNEETDESDCFDEQNLQNIVETAVKFKLEELLRVNNVSSIRNINEAETINTPKKNEGKTPNQIDLGLESELIIEDDVKIESDDEDDVMKENITLVNSEHVSPTTQIDMAAVGDTTDNNNTIGDDNVNETVSDEYMRKFFDELGEVMTVELPVEKKKILKARINALLKKFLEEGSISILAP